MIDADEIADDLIKQLDGLGEYDVRSHLDFTEKRPSPIMVVVSCDGTTQMNEGLPDYRIHYSILIDSLISDDEDGEAFKETLKAVERKLEQITDRDFDLSNAFTSPYVVAAFLTGSTRSLTQDSNRCIIGVDVITSE